MTAEPCHSSEELLPYLTPTDIIDSGHPEVREYAERVCGKVSDPVEKAVRLYLAVRDDIWYDPYGPFFLPEHYRASGVLKRKRGFCIPKAVLLCALGRASDIPCRMGFADVKNHLATRQLIEKLQTNVFAYHAFVELYVNCRWVKATPAFNRELCQRHMVPPLEFNGMDDSLFQACNGEKKRFMEYVRIHPSSADVHIDRILEAWGETYGKERVKQWMRAYEQPGQRPARDFMAEEVLQPEQEGGKVG